MPVAAKCPRCGDGLQVASLMTGEEGSPWGSCDSCSLVFLYDFTGLDPGGTTPAVEFAPNVRIPGYLLVGTLARGGMGYIYSAVREEDDTLVALKVLPPRVASYPPLVARFEREIHLMRSLRHPNVMGILDAGLVGTTRYLTMPFIPGKTLKARLMEEGPLTTAEIGSILRPLSEGLNQLHLSAILHRDLKPANILLTASGDVLLLDLGVACERGRENDLTQHDVTVGTPAYLAPEVYERGEMTPLSDLFSLAVIVYEMLTGMLPIGVFDPPCESRLDLPKESEHALLAALSHHPHRRFDTVQAFGRAFCRPLRGMVSAEEAPALISRAAIPSQAVLERAGTYMVGARKQSNQRVIRTLLARMGLGAS